MPSSNAMDTEFFEYSAGSAAPHAFLTDISRRWRVFYSGRAFALALIFQSGLTAAATAGLARLVAATCLRVIVVALVLVGADSAFVVVVRSWPEQLTRWL